MLKFKRWGALFCLAAGIGSGAASASTTIIFSQPFTGQTVGLASDVDTNTRVSEDFRFDQDATITGATFYGFDFSPLPGPDNFIFSFSNDASGIPNSAPAQTYAASITGTNTSSLATSLQFGGLGLAPVLRYDVTFSSGFDVAANTDYHFSVFDRDRNNNFWHWVGGVGPQGERITLGPASSGSTSGVQNQFQMAFSLTAQVKPAVPAIPEPSSWLLMLAGFAVTGITLKKRHVKTAVSPA